VSLFTVLLVHVAERRCIGEVSGKIAPTTAQNISAKCKILFNIYQWSLHVELAEPRAHARACIRVSRSCDISRVAKNLTPKYNESSFEKERERERERERKLSLPPFLFYIFISRLYMRARVSIPLEFSPIEQPIEVVDSIGGNKNARVLNTRGISLSLSPFCILFFIALFFVAFRTLYSMFRT